MNEAPVPSGVVSPGFLEGSAVYAFNPPGNGKDVDSQEVLSVVAGPLPPMCGVRCAVCGLANNRLIINPAQSASVPAGKTLAV
jgi:hypothetical protein